MELFEDAMHLFERGLHRRPAGLATIVEIAYTMNGEGKQRRRSMDEVIDRILRGHTPKRPRKWIVKIWSDLHGDMKSRRNEKRPSHLDIEM